MILFDPINQTKIPVTYDKVVGITGKKQGDLASLKSKGKRIENINCYLLDDDVCINRIREIINSAVIEEKEIWKLISGTKDYYISNLGRIKHKDRIMIKYPKKGKKHCVKIKTDKLREVFVHKIVANSFLELEGNVVYHKDGNIYNNRAENLDNIDKRLLGKKTGGLSKSIPVIKINPNTNERLEEYESMAEAGRENYIHRETIRLCIRGKLKTAGGFKWIIDKEFSKVN